MDNHSFFTHKRHADSIQSPACIGRKRALSTRQKPDAPRLDHYAYWFGIFNAIVYFVGNFYTVVYSGPYYLFEDRRGEGTGKEVRAGISWLQATGADVYSAINKEVKWLVIAGVAKQSQGGEGRKNPSQSPFFERERNEVY